MLENENASGVERSIEAAEEERGELLLCRRELSAECQRCTERIEALERFIKAGRELLERRKELIAVSKERDA